MQRRSLLSQIHQLASLRNTVSPHLPHDTALAVTAWLQHRGAKKQASELRAGNVVDSDGRICSVTKVDYTQGSGRQLGNVHLELRDVQVGRKTQERKRPYDMVEVVRLESETYQYLYDEGGQLIFMHPATFEQLAVPPDVLHAQQPFLKEGSQLTLNLLDGEPISGPESYWRVMIECTVCIGELPGAVTLTVLETEPYVQGDSASAGSKGAILETGLQIMVPPYVQPGEAIVVNSSTKAFVKRAS